jgi:uncharacterized protein YjaZ
MAVDFKLSSKFIVAQRDSIAQRDAIDAKTINQDVTLFLHNNETM